MRIFMYELKKLFNRKILLALIALGALTYFAFLSEVFPSYESLKYHGIFNAYQLEMFEKYGNELTPEEYADYDVPGKIAALTTQLDEIIASEPTFAKYGITGYADYDEGIQAFHEKYFINTSPEPLPQSYISDYNLMQAAIEQSFAYVDHQAVPVKIGGDTSMTESPSSNIQALKTVETYYTPDNEFSHDFLRSFADYDLRPVVSKAAAAYLKRTTFNLINYDLTSDFSLYAAMAAVFAVLASLILSAPFITTDRARKMQYLQYAAKAGRRVFRTQILAAATAALLVGVAVIAASYGAFFAQTDAANYLNCGAQLFTGGFFLYDITFGQYVAVLAGMTLALCLVATCFAVILGRYSSNIIGMMLKAVPVGAAVSVLAAFALFYALKAENFLFSGHIARITGSVPYAEVVICGTVALIGVAAMTVVVVRERKVDVA